MNRPAPSYEFGVYRLDVAEHRLLRGSDPVPLTPKMFALLRVLLENAGHLVEKEQLLRDVWSDTFVEEANLNRGISVLRKTLGETVDAQYIETVPKRGYRFVAAVRAVDSEPSAATAAPDNAAIVPTGASRTRARRAVAGLALGTALAGAAIAYVVIGRSAPPQAGTATRTPVHRQVTFTGREATPTLSRDGRRLAYVSNEPPNRTVMVQELDGGKPTPVFSGPETGWLRWSPDGSELMFWARGGGTDGLYIARPSAGVARRIAPGGTFVAGWSPDGSTIALASFLAKKVLFLDKAGEVQRSIALHGIRDWIWDIDWSPVHGRLLFVADDEERRGAIWTIEADGRDQKKVFSAAMEILAARWGPEGDSVYYFGRVNQTVSLYKADLDSNQVAAPGTPVPLLSGLETDEGFGLSADGTRLVYARSPYYSNLFLVEVDDSSGVRQVRQTALTSGTSVVERPRVSPDGASILVSIGYESRADLYTIPTRGGTPKQLTFLNAFSIGGVWAPDGRSVAFASTEGGKARIWVAGADGSSSHPLPSADLSESYELAWFPGTRLLYQQEGNRNYYAIDPQTPGDQLLVKDPSVGWVSSSAYSPDGKKLAVSWNRKPSRGLWVIDSLDSSETLVRGVSNPSENALMPIGWSLDGRFIYAWDGKRAAYRGISVPFELTVTDARIFKVSVADGHVEPILTLPFDEVGTVTAFPDGRRFLCTVYTARSDIWIVENFDGDARSRSARR